jgi:hypothetical protein
MNGLYMFISWKILVKWMMNRGTPHFWKPPFDDLKIPEEIDEEIDHDRSQFTTWKYRWPGTLGHSSFPCQLS